MKKYLSTFTKIIMLFLGIITIYTCLFGVPTNDVMAEQGQDWRWDTIACFLNGQPSGEGFECIWPGDDCTKTQPCCPPWDCD